MKTIIAEKGSHTYRKVDASELEDTEMVAIGDNIGRTMFGHDDTATFNEDLSPVKE